MTVAILVLALAALATAVLALRRVDVVERRARQWLTEAGAPTDPISAGTSAANPAGSLTGVDQTSRAASARPAEPGAAAELADLRRRVDALSAPERTSGLNRIGVVRYDALDDLGGRLSFSAAIVDDQGRGLVLTVIHGRSETRSYLKQVPVTEQSNQRDLSPEETQAVTEALAGSGRG